MSAGYRGDSPAVYSDVSVKVEAPRNEVSEAGKLPKEISAPSEVAGLPKEIKISTELPSKDETEQRIKEETGWSDEITDNIRSMEEYKIYKDAGLKEAEIDGKKCLIRSDIDWDRKYETGKYDENGNMRYETNRERVAAGKAPLDENGKPIELHHIGQHADSPLAELTFSEHRCNGNDSILHDKTKETEAHGEGNTWDKERQEYWKNRANYNEGAA